MNNSEFQPVHRGEMKPPEKKTPGWAWGVGIISVLALLWLIGTIASDTRDEPARTTATTSRVETTVDRAASESRAAAASSSAAAATASRAAAAEASRQAAAAAQAAKMDPSTYERLDERSLAEIVRDPNAHKNRKIVIYGNVVQADAGTGTSRFRANIASWQGWNWYDFDENAIINATDRALVSRVIKDDLVEMFVEVKGALSYSTTLGGETTAPEFTVNMLNVYGSD